MTKKKLLERSEVRQFAKLANLDTLTEERLQEMGLDEEVVEEEDSLEEDNGEQLEEGDGEQLEEGEGKGPNREGAGKDGEHKGIAKNQGKEPKKSPDGKVDHSHADHKLKDLSVSKKDIDGGTPLVEGEELNEMPEDDLELDDEEGLEPPADDLGGEELPADDLDGEPGLDDPALDAAPAPADGDLAARMIKAVADALADVTGMEIEVNDETAGGDMDLEPEGDPMGDPMGEPMDDLPPPPEGDNLELGDTNSDDEEDVMQELDLSSVKTEALEAELEERKSVAESEELTAEQKIDQIAESIMKRLFKNKK